MSPSRHRGRVWVRLLLVVAVLLVAVAGGVVTIGLVAYDQATDHGEASPDAAGYAFVLTFNPDVRDQTIGVPRLVTPGRRTAVLQQRADYVRQIETDASEHGYAPVRFETDGGANDKTEVTGDRATVVLWIKTAVFSTNGSGVTYEGSALAWHFTVHHDGDRGWRIESFTPPKWCGGYSACGMRSGQETAPTS